MTRPPPGGVPLERLVDTRLQLHHAVQSLTSFAQALVDPMEDDAHRSFDWDVGVRGFRTRGATAAPDTTAVFLVEAFEVRIEREDAVLAVVPVRGWTGVRLRNALQGAARECVTGATGRPEFVAPEFDLPDHPTGGGDVPFDPDGRALEELAGWFTHADLAVLRLEERLGASGPHRAGRSGDTPIDVARVWPHHLDLSTLLHPDGGSVGVGLSPGDASIPHPYWYVRGYPDAEAGAACPAGEELPTLSLGRWKESGWTGALLEATELAPLSSREAVDDAVDAFLDTTVPTCIHLLGP